MLTTHRIDACIDAVRAVANSPKIRSYLIGFTTKTAGKKGDDYRSIGFNNLVILADKMNKADAHALEEELKNYCCKRKTSILYEKYHKEKRDGGYYKSDGNTKVDALAPVHSVYMVWW